MKVVAFDRDRTVETGIPSGPVPLGWVRYLARETDHEVWAIGNQALTREAGIPGIAEAVDRHPAESSSSRYPEFEFSRARRVRMVGELFPDATGYVVVDDADLSGLDGWDHFFPRAFVRAAEAGDLDLPLPPD